jgi:acyl-CoA synthetase (AMP-forming)/AMP-acid ligase II
VLLTAPGVHDSVVIGLPDQVWGEIIAAVIVPNGDSVQPAEILAHCKRFLASYRCPDRIFFREDLPYNASGKVDRSILRQELEQELSE